MIRLFGLLISYKMFCLFDQHNMFTIPIIIFIRTVSMEGDLYRAIFLCDTRPRNRLYRGVRRTAPFIRRL